MNNNRIDRIVCTAGLRLFGDRYNSSNNVRAELIMDSRSHFYSPNTMRFFACRVVSVRVSDNGLLMYAVFSNKAGFDDPSRVWGFAIHDCSGRHLAGTVDFPTRRKAEAAMWAALAPLESDPVAVLRNMLNEQKRRHESDLGQVRQALRPMPRKRRSVKV